MKNAKSIGLILAGFLTIVTVTDTQAFWKNDKQRIRKSNAAQENTFSVSGVFTGSLEGQIVVGKRKVSLTDKTSIYVIGEGTHDDNPFVSGASVYVGGVMKNGARQAAFVVVRTTRPTLTTRGGQVQDASHSIPSAVNPNVGQWVEGYE